MSRHCDRRNERRLWVWLTDIRVWCENQDFSQSPETRNWGELTKSD
jgi:hypothetical protein